MTGYIHMLISWLLERYTDFKVVQGCGQGRTYRIKGIWIKHHIAIRNIEHAHELAEEWKRLGRTA